VALSVTGFQLVTSAMAGYALARLKFPTRHAANCLGNASDSVSMLVIPIFLVPQMGTSDQHLRGANFATAVNGFGIFLRNSISNSAS